MIIRDADVLPMVEPSPTNQYPAEQPTHDQRVDTVVAIPDTHLVRSETKDFLGDHCHSVEPQTPPIPRISISERRVRSGPDGSVIFEAQLTRNAHHQDFYASRWFRFIQIFSLVIVVLAAFVVFILSSLLTRVDIFGSEAVFLLPVIFLSPVFLFLCIVVGGVFKSKVFR